MILELENALELDKDVQPACLPFNANFDDISFTEEQCFTSGWGALEQSKSILVSKSS